MQRELGGAGLDGIQDQVAVEPYTFRIRLHIRTGLLEDGACFAIHEVHAHLFEDGQGGVVEGFKFILGHDGRVREAVLQLAVLGGGQCGPHRATGAACPAARRSGA
jgi:hypothetical protein